MDFLGPGPERRGDPPWHGGTGGEAAGETDPRPYRDGFRYGDPGPLTDEPAAERSAGGYGAGAETLGYTAGGAAVTDGRLAGGEVLESRPERPQVGGEVLESGPERPQGGVDWLARDVRRWWRGVGSATPWRRRAIAATATLAAAGVLVALRAGAPSVPLEEAAAGDAASAPVIIYGRARLQPPPFDRLPGRTPIPTPSPVGRPAEAVRGALPATGPVGEEAARDASRLVLGRYCRWPRGYQVQLEPKRSWHEVTATILSRTYVGSRRLTTLQLRWTGHAYSWQGWPAELARCA